jgi:hypothetical protein
MQPPDLLILAMGHEPLPLLVQIARFRPSAVLIVCTKQTATATRRLFAVLARRMPACLALPPVELQQGHGTDAVAEAVGTAVMAWMQASGRDTEGRVLADVTGGTKIMSLGILQACRAGLSQEGLDAVYLDVVRSVDVRSGQTLDVSESFVISVRDVAALRGHVIDRVGREGTLASKFPELEETGVPGLRRWQRLVLEPHGPETADGTWLELACAAAIRQAVAKADRDSVSVVWSCTTMPGPDQPIDETDLVLVRGSRVVVVEAKSGKQSGSAEVRKRLAMVDATFGTSAHVVFVAPRRTSAGMKALRAVLDNRRVTQALTPDDLVNAVRRHLWP